MQETEWEFAEIWADTLISPPYILMLVKEKSDFGSPGYSVISESYMTPGMSFNTCTGGIL
ncbi:hypothetical protein [Microcoleus sp. herbarium12]|uniref:hypothetical protein n=1 Tax=Microcoleus sp. herbarium12 TaxID=3055437 RepID=UPI002FD4219E